MKSTEAFGHCAPCVEFTVQPYRKSVKPEKCHNCICYWAGREDAAQAVDAACRMWQCSREELAHYTEAARGDGAQA